MPLIDFHLHPPVVDAASADYHDFIAGYQGEAQAFYARYEAADDLVNLLDREGVDYAVVLAKLTPITTGIYDNDAVRRLTAASPKLIPFASVNPYTQVNPARELRRCVIEQGFRGLKMYPTYQYFYPNDPLVYPIYAVCEELGIPVMVHTGSSVFRGARIKYGNPMALDDVAIDFPDLKIVLCHGGRPAWYGEAAALCRFHPNVYIDLAGLPPRKLPLYFPDLARMTNKLLFGSDWPGIPGSISDNARAIRALPISKEAQEHILWKNAAELLPGLRLENGNGTGAS